MEEDKKGGHSPHSQQMPVTGTALKDYDFGGKKGAEDFRLQLGQPNTSTGDTFP